MTHVVCLCCGTRYDVNEDCPHLHTTPHSASLARLVALYLLQHDLPATASTVRQAREAIEAEARALIESARLQG